MSVKLTRLRPLEVAPRPFDRRALVRRIRRDRVDRVNEILRELRIPERPRERPKTTPEELGWVSHGRATEL